MAKKVSKKRFKKEVYFINELSEKMTDCVTKLHNRVTKIETYLYTHGLPRSEEKKMQAEAVGEIKEFKGTNIEKCVRKYIKKYLKKYLPIYFEESTRIILNAILEDIKEMDEEDNADDSEDNHEDDDTLHCCGYSVKRVGLEDLPKEVQECIGDLIKMSCGGCKCKDYQPAKGDIIGIVKEDYYGTFGEIESYDEDTDTYKAYVATPGNTGNNRELLELKRDEFQYLGSPFSKEWKDEKEKTPEGMEDAEKEPDKSAEDASEDILNERADEEENKFDD